MYNRLQYNPQGPGQAEQVTSPMVTFVRLFVRFRVLYFDF